MTFRWVEALGKSNQDAFRDYHDRNKYGAYLAKGIGSAWSYYLTDCEPNGVNP